VKLRQDLLNGFEDSGAALPPDKRKRAKELLDRIEDTRQAFERNVREDPTTVVFTPAEMEGVSEAYLKARKKDEAGNYVLRLDQPSYSGFMNNAKSEKARERYYRARFQQGGVKNLELLQQIFTLRQELASLYDLPSFAAYGLRRKMAGNPEAVNKFLRQVKEAVTPVEKLELEELRAEKAREQGTELAATRLRNWDVNYYFERLRRAKYDVDQEKLRAYFPADKSMDFSMLLAERLYAIKFRETQVPTWHADVRHFEVLDGPSGRFLGNIYVDIYPREGKRPGAFAAPLRTASTLAHRLPSVALVANLNRQGLNQNELETLLHELGHVLNIVLSHSAYGPQSFSTVKWDFVEAPSQMFEEWARREQTLALFKEVCAECPQLTSAQIKRLEEARRFGQATGYGRQWLLAAFDMEMSTRPRPPLEVWKQLESAMPLGHVEGTMFPTAFTHIASGYAAGYYGYMWSRVIARDLLSAYQGNLLDTRVSTRYRSTILGAGNEREEVDMVRAFLGRDPSPEPFFAEITGKS
jgi:thimet oligopeptidase